jgi:hypothetical protein
MQTESSIDRARLAWTKWLPMTSVAAAIAFVIGFVMQLPEHQVISAAALTGTLVMSGLAMRSYGREHRSEMTQA